MRSLFRNTKYILAFLILAFLSAVYSAFATPPASRYVPGETLDPTCAPGDAECSVIPINIGDEVGSGNAASVLFIDDTGLLGEDNTNFLYDVSSQYLYSDNLALANNLEITTTTSSTVGVITKDSVRFIHTYKPAGTNDNLFIGKTSGNFTLAATSNFNGNIGIGQNALTSLSSGYFNTILGAYAGNSVTTGYSNVFIGTQASRNNATGLRNVAIGDAALYGSGHVNHSSTDNVSLGQSSMYFTSTSAKNIAIGTEAGYNNSSASNNVFIGYQSGHDITTESGNIFIGYLSGSDATGSDKLYIENSASESPLIYGDFASDIVSINGNFGIGDSSPSAALTVGSGDVFRVDSLGAIVAATGITSSGPIIFSGLSTGVILSSSGTLSSSLGAANQFLGVNSAGTANEYKTISVGTSGTDFAVANSSGAIAFNLPTASAANRGALSSADWTTFNAKADDFLDLSDTPDSYTSKTNKIVSVNTGATGLGFGPDVLEDSGNFRIGSNTSFGAIYNTVVGTGNRMGVASSRNTLIGYNINNAGNSYGENTIIGPAELAVNADTMTIMGSVVNHARIAGMVAIGSYFTLPTSGVYSSQTSNSPVYIGYNINNSETAASTKGNIFIGRNISTAGFTSNATTKAIVIAQDPTLENGMQNSVVIGADTSVLDEESNVTVIGSGAMAYLDPTYGNGGGDGVAIGRNSKTGSWRATALGAYSQALAVSSMAIGYGAYTNSSHGISIGRGSYNDTAGAVVIQPVASTGSTELATVYVGAIGSYWTNTAMPSTETIDLSSVLNAGTAISRITGISGRDTRGTPLLTNIRGGHLRILGGQSTGTAEGGDIQFAVTPAGGASNNTLNSEFVSGAFKSDKKFYLYDTPNNDDALNQVLVRDDSTGEIMYKDSSSFNYFTGSVGIGTDTSPDYLLEVENSGSDTNIFGLVDSDGSCLHNPEAGSEVVTCSSDERLKENIVDAGEILPYFRGFNIREYDVLASGDHMFGVIAQEVDEVYPDLVKKGSNGYLTVEIPTSWEMIKAIQELDISVSNISSLDVENENSLANLLVVWFADAANGIGRLFAKEIHTDMLCVGDTCVTEEEFLKLLGNNNTQIEDNGSDGSGQSEPVPEGDILPIEEEVENPTIESDEPTPESEDPEDQNSGESDESSGDGDASSSGETSSEV